MEFIWYLIVGIIGFIFGGACTLVTIKCKHAGTIRLIKDGTDGSYYLAADLDIHPADLINEKKVVFDVRDPEKTNILEIRKDTK